MMKIALPKYLAVFLAGVALFWAVDRGMAGQLQGAALSPAGGDTTQGTATRSRMTQAERAEAAVRAAAAAQANTADTRALAVAVPGPGTAPDYFGIYPNWAWTPPIRKFVNSLPGLGLPGCNPATTCNANNLGQYIPVAEADTTTFPGSDYYEIGLRDYTQKMHTDLPATKLRGYYQKNSASGVNQYLGPVILAERNKPVRIKFDNELAAGAAGNLFIPVDTTVMGAGMGPDGSYSQNRATLHLHGGLTPWISDGTPHQWVTPPGELAAGVTPATQLEGVSTQDVPDMTPSGAGSMTFYFPNQQSGRLMFYHDHSYGITRLNVYAGEAAGYLLVDPVEKDLINGTNLTGGNPPIAPAAAPAAILPSLPLPYTYGIPLVIQDKTFVDSTSIAGTDPTWNWGTTAPTPNSGDLWFPHVYMPNQNPWDLTGANAMGRWDYGPWFWPPMPATGPGSPAVGPQPNPYCLPTPGLDCSATPGEPPTIPGTPNPSLVPEAFMDTPLVNGTAYPFLPVERRAYRLRILNACNDRFLNLQLYFIDPAVGTPTEVKMVPAVPHAKAGEPVTTLDGLRECVGTEPVNPVSGLPTGCWPTQWPTDGRDGGVPNPALAGPPLIQIGTEGGLLPAPVVINSQPVVYNYNRRDIVVLNIADHGLYLGPAERADVIVDFSGVPAGSKLILYNDAPAPVPAFDPRLDYYTGDPDFTLATGDGTGGAPTTAAGYGPNTRTIMRFDVGSAAAAAPYSLTKLQANLPKAFAVAQDKIIVPEPEYNAAYGASFPATYSTIQANSLTFTPIGGTPLKIDMGSKAIQELFEMDYGRMNATLGVELPFTTMQNQTTIPLGYIDPPTEILADSVTPGAPLVTLAGTAADGTQLWKITHNGVDTHAIHFHLFNVQVVNRVGWDGAIRPPDANELGWKETVKMNPLEDIIVAMRPVAPSLPFGVPLSFRSFDVTKPESASWQAINPADNTTYTVYNTKADFGWEYVWHCHLLGHEENDMMRPLVLDVTTTLPDAPVLSVTQATGPLVNLTWTDSTPVGPNPAKPLNLGNPKNEIGFEIERVGTLTLPVPPSPAFAPFGTALANATTAADNSVAIGGPAFSYRVRAYNASGVSPWSNTASLDTAGSFNHAPSFTKGLDQSVYLAAPPQSVTLVGWATNINANDPAQTVNFIVSNNNTALFSAQPAINPAGTLTFTLSGTVGVATVTVLVHDTGGTANGGVDTSAPQTFTITVKSMPQLEVTAPAAGANWLQGSAHAVTWFGSAVTGTGNVSIGLYQGTVFKSWLNSSKLNNGTFTWNIPWTLATGSYSVRVTLLSNPAILATSGAFTVSSPLSVTAPAAGAVLQQGTVQTVTWSGVPVTGNVSIGIYQGTVFKSWVSSSTLNDGAFDWTVPPALAPGAYTVRVTWLSNPSVFGTSGAFSVISPTLLVTLPDGTAQLQQGTVQPVAWSGVPFTGNVSIGLYQGTVFKSWLNSSTLNDGAFDWTVPPTLAPGTYTVRVTWLSNSAVFGTSNAFTVTSPILSVSSPVGTVTRGSATTVNWSLSGPVTSGNVSIGIYQGTVFKIWASSSTPNDGAFTWTVPTTLAPGSYTLRVTWISNPAVIGTIAITIN